MFKPESSELKKFTFLHIKKSKYNFFYIKKKSTVSVLMIQAYDISNYILIIIIKLTIQKMKDKNKSGNLIISQLICYTFKVGQI